jgi:hypothetical protein
LCPRCSSALGSQVVSACCSVACCRVRDTPHAGADCVKYGRWLVQRTHPGACSCAMVGGVFWGRGGRGGSWEDTSCHMGMACVHIDSANAQPSLPWPHSQGVAPAWQVALFGTQEPSAQWRVLTCQQYRLAGQQQPCMSWGCPWQEYGALLCFWVPSFVAPRVQ